MQRHVIQQIEVRPAGGAAAEAAEGCVNSDRLLVLPLLAAPAAASFGAAQKRQPEAPERQRQLDGE